MSEQTAEQTTETTATTTERREAMDSNTFGTVWVEGVKNKKTLLEIVDDLGLDPQDDKDVSYVRQKSTQLRKFIEKVSEGTKTLPKLTNMAPRRAALDISFAVDMPKEEASETETPAE